MASDQLIFISYRRLDNVKAPAWLHETLSAVFGSSRVFMDTDAIRGGEDWQMKINESLARAGAIVALIGEQWLKAPDSDGRRRLDNPDDWVLNEISAGLEGRAVVIPVLIDETRMPRPEALPERIRALPNCQAIRIREGTFARDRKPLLNRLEELGFERIEGEINYPVPVIRRDPLSEIELEQAEKRLPQWTRRERPNRRARGGEAQEFYRKFSFNSFHDAMDFMMMASRDATELKHHPDWRNVYQELEVWLSTWDERHILTELDVKLAQRLDALYNRHFKI